MLNKVPPVGDKVPVSDVPTKSQRPQITLVLLPGMDGTGLLFADFVAALELEFEAVVVSYPADRALDYPELEAVARTCLPKNKPFVLLGESFSGPIAISIAATSPPGLLGLVLCCSFARNPRPALTMLRWLLPAIPIKYMPMGLLHAFLLGRFKSPQLCSALSQAIAQVSSSALKERLKAVLSIDVSDKLAAVSVPLLYLRASADLTVPHSSSELIARLVPDLREVVFEAPHFLLQVLPSVAAKTVCEFLREVKADYVRSS